MPNHPHSMIINEYEAADIAQQMDPRTVASMVGAGGLSLASAPLGHSASVAPTHKPPTKCGTCCRFLRKVISFLLSHIGLLSLVVGYCIMGAFVFEILERENELMVKLNRIQHVVFVNFKGNFILHCSWLFMACSMSFVFLCVCLFYNFDLSNSLLQGFLKVFCIKILEKYKDKVGEKTPYKKCSIFIISVRKSR